jgi:Zn finger protein HypA/HybF involved in hydrogenase expression
MFEIVCEHCGHEQTVTVFDLNPECENCGSKKLREKVS